MKHVSSFILLLASVCSDASTPTHVGELSANLASLQSPTLGCLSQGNFDTVHHLIPPETAAVVFEDVAHLMTAVHDGTVSAGLLSGTPPPHEGVTSFTSTLISPRAMLTCTSDECDTLTEAIDASIVRALHNATDAAAARAHAPFAYVSVHTCKTNEPDERFPFPTARLNDRLYNATQRGTVKIGALGPYDWGNSGNYKATPPIGFWPDFYDAVEAYFKEGTGISFERVWWNSSDAVMAAVENGDADVTEPYWTVDAYYKDRARQHMFDTSCTTIGYDSTFVVKTQEQVTSASTTGVDATTVVVASSVGGTVILAALVFVLYLRQRERGGAPLWNPVTPASG